MNITRTLLGAVVVAAAIGLTGCASASTPAATTSASETTIGGDVIAPVTMSVNELQGETVDLLVGQVLNINTDSMAVDSYTAEIADEKVARFTQGREDGSATFNPGIEGLAAGETEVVLTNRNGGIQPLRFTVIVTAK